MADPNTVNVGLLVPTRGSDVGTWDVPVNADFTAIDGLFGGVQNISLSNAPVTLTAPSVSITPSGGPTQAQNAVIVLTGALSANVQVTLPLPGSQRIINRTTGNFVLTFRAVGSGEIIATKQGANRTIYNDGTNVRFLDLPDPGAMEFWAGYSAMPAWVAACSVKPYLLCDSSGTIYNFSDYPYLGPQMGSSFGGNGITTFGIPDMAGRVPLAYDSSGTRITTAGSGLNGQTMGASIDSQSVTLTSGQIPAHTHPNTLTDPGHAHTYNNPVYTSGQISGGSTQGTTGATSGTSGSSPTGITITNAANTGGGGSHPNVQPSQVAGIWVIKT